MGEANAGNYCRRPGGPVDPGHGQLVHLLGGVVHILLVLAIVVILIRVIQGRRV